MMNKSVGKKLRQTTLDFITSSTSQSKKRKMADSKQIEDFETVEDESSKKRNKLLEAAEKRKETNSPYFTNAPSVSQKTDIKPKDKPSKSEDNQGTSEASETANIKLEDKLCKSEVSRCSTEASETANIKPEDKPCKSKVSRGSTEASEITETQKYTQSIESDVGDFEDLTHNALTDRDDKNSFIQIPNKKPIRKAEGHWKGVDKSELHTAPACLKNVQPLKSSDKHIVMFKLPYQYDVNHTQIAPTPHPIRYTDRWDSDHVRMPCSNENQYPVETKGKSHFVCFLKGKTQLCRRWQLIDEALTKDIAGPYELEDAILTYNQRYKDKWSFSALNHFFTKHIESQDRHEFFGTTLKDMVKLALKLPHLCKKPIPLLKRNQNKSITMSQEQVACLLANAFFCTFPRRNTKSRSAEYSSYPDINFNSLFQGTPNNRKMEKLKCIIHYFKRVTRQMPIGVVTFTRQSVSKFPDWNNLDVNLTRLHVSSIGTIEDDGKGMLQVDFANKFIGGGVLGHGCVQEEIRFLICPEMLVTRLFTECLDKRDSLIMLGCEQFSTYEGYADTFLWAENHYDQTSRDINGRLCTEVVAIDALIINEYGLQFQNFSVVRELNKAYCGFLSSESNLPAVCTGNWGCGAFGGDKKLKALIQLFAAAAAQRDVCYFTFDDNKLVDELYALHCYLTEENQLSIGNIMELISDYYLKMCRKTYREPKKNLFEYIYEKFDAADDFMQLDSPASDKSESQPRSIDSNVSMDYKAYTP